MLKFILKKLQNKYIWERIWVERLSEPLHLNLASFFVLLFGSFRQKVDYDLIIRPQHAWGLLAIADMARSQNQKVLTVIEFGVANGAGLMNLARVADSVTKATGVRFNVVGFDTGEGLPPPQDYRDHPEHFQSGDYPLVDKEKLKKALPDNCRLILGNVKETVPKFLLEHKDPIAFVSFDLDYYSSTQDALKIFSGPVSNYLPWAIIYLDDVQYYTHNRYAGPLLAIDDFNKLSQKRKIDRIECIAWKRLFKRQHWLYQMYMVHFFDHPFREKMLHQKGQAVDLPNYYL